jgi:tRNA/rRNA methyltransferase
VVLVRPQIASNIGAVARIMRNLGFADLVLVAPEADVNDPRAERLATRHGLPVLQAAQVVADLGAAVADCLMVAATSALVGGLCRRQPVGTPEDVVLHLLKVLPAGPVALVFGPEPSGLTNEEVVRCHYLIHIPTEPASPALNLAQAVAICLYVCRRALLSQAGQVTSPEPAAPFGALERMFVSLRQALEGIHFLYGPKAEALMHALRHLIGRAGPTEKELKLLHGLARQIRWLGDRAKMFGCGTPFADSGRATEGHFSEVIIPTPPEVGFSPPARANGDTGPNSAGPDHNAARLSEGLGGSQ